MPAETCNHADLIAALKAAVAALAAVVGILFWRLVAAYEQLRTDAREDCDTDKHIADALTSLAANQATLNQSSRNGGRNGSSTN